MDAQRVEVFHVADRDAVVVFVAHHFVLDLFPSFERFFDQDLRRVGEGLGGQRVQFIVVVAEAGTESSQRIGRPDNDRIAQGVGHAFGFGDGGDGFAFDGLDVDFVQFVYEQVAVFGVHNGLHGGAEHAHAVFFEHAAFVELHAAVQGGLAAEREQNAVRTFPGDDVFDEIRRYGQEVNLVGDSFAGLHGGDIRVDQDGVYPLFLEGLEGRGTRVVEFARFADLQCARTEQHHFFYAVVSGG